MRSEPIFSAVMGGGILAIAVVGIGAHSFGLTYGLVPQFIAATVGIVSAWTYLRKDRPAPPKDDKP